MNFGRLISLIREEKRLNISEVAEKAGIDPATISRLENERTEPTIRTVAQLSKGLGLTLEKVANQLSISPFLVPDGDRAGASDLSIFLDQDLVNLVQLAILNPSQLNSIIANLFNFVAGHENLYQAKHIELSLNATSGLFLGSEYPQLPSPGFIKQVFLNSGALLPIDLVTYLRLLRNQKGFSLSELANELDWTTSMVSRIERGHIDRISLVDVIKLNRNLGDGEIFGMFWSVFSLINALTAVYPDYSQDKLSTQIETFVIGIRWLQIQSPLVFSDWLKGYRLAVAPYPELS